MSKILVVLLVLSVVFAFYSIKLMVTDRLSSLGKSLSHIVTENCGILSITDKLLGQRLEVGFG